MQNLHRDVTFRPDEYSTNQKPSPSRGKRGLREKEDAGGYGRSAIENGVPMFDVILLGFKQVTWVVENSNRANGIAFAIRLAPAFAGLIFADKRLNDFETLRDDTENGMAIVEESGRNCCDEKLGSVGAGTCIGHGEDSGAIVAEGGMELVGKAIPWAPSTSPGWISTLNHELIDHPMECHAVVVSSSSKVQKIGAGEGNLRGEKGSMNVSLVGMESDTDVGHGS